MRPRHWSLLPLAAAAATGVLVGAAPLVTTSSCVASSAGPMACSTTSRSLVASEGAGVLAVLAVPVLVTLVPVLWPGPRPRVAAAALLSLAAFVALASVGIFLLPTVVLAWVAVAATHSPPPRLVPEAGPG